MLEETGQEGLYQQSEVGWLASPDNELGPESLVPIGEDVTMPTLEPSSEAMWSTSEVQREEGTWSPASTSATGSPVRALSELLQRQETVNEFKGIQLGRTQTGELVFWPAC